MVQEASHQGKILQQWVTEIPAPRKDSNGLEQVCICGEVQGTVGVSLIMAGTESLECRVDGLGCIRTEFKVYRVAISTPGVQTMTAGGQLHHEEVKQHNSLVCLVL